MQPARSPVCYGVSKVWFDLHLIPSWNKYNWWWEIGQHMVPSLPPSSRPRHGWRTRHSWLHASHVIYGQWQREQPPFIKVSTWTKNYSIDLCDSHERSILQMRTLRFRDWLAPTVVKYWARSRTQLYCSVQVNHYDTLPSGCGLKEKEEVYSGLGQAK